MRVVVADLTATFPEQIRQRGTTYFVSGAVRIIKKSRAEILAYVDGSHEYVTGLTMEGARLTLSCECRYFLTDGPCKHLWATILAAEGMGALAVLPVFKEIRLDAEGGDDEDDPGDVVASPAPSPMLAAYRRDSAAARQAGPGQVAPPPPWKDLLLRARSYGAVAASPGKWTGRLLYVVDVERNYHGSLTLSLFERARGKTGEWAKPKPAHIPLDALGNLEDDIDRRVLPLLLGAGAIADGAPSYSSYSSGYKRIFPPQVHLPMAMAGMVMPLLSQSERLHVRAARHAELVPARYDDGDPWEFVLCMCRPTGRPGTEVTGLLRRGGSTMNLADPLLVTHDGWLVLPDRIGRFTHFGAMGLLTSLRKQKVVDVPAAHEKDFLSDLLEQPGLPRLELPSDLALRELAPRPRPELSVEGESRGRGYQQTERFSALLSFDYEGHRLKAGDSRSVVARVEAGLLIRRDRQAEADAALRLGALGFRPAYASYLAPAAQDRFEIAPKKLPAAVRLLTSEGWHVQAEGRRYRAASHFSLSVASGIDWFDLTATADFGGVTATLPQLLCALRRGESMLVLDDGTLGLLPEEWLQKHALLAAMGTENGDKLRFARRQAGLLDALLLAEPDAKVDRLFGKARDELGRFEGVAPEKAPRGFKGDLRPYQEVGLGWLTFLRRFGFGGCLADDMGLGKTVQVLAMLEARRPKAKRPSLVVMPKSLIWNWGQEAARFTPRLKLLAHVGADRATRAEALTGVDLVLTTYGTMRSDIALLREIEFDGVILDEAQAIKNVASESAKAARLLRGEHRLALSGTPIENHIGELWSLFEFLNPGMLGAASAFEGVTRRGRPSPETVGVLSRALRPFILRRTKEVVAPELPPKHQETLLCELDAPQRALYNELRDHYRASLLGKLKSDAPASLGKSKILVLEALLRLRQASCHPGLIDKRRARETSAKLDVLLPRLDEVRAEGHKALVFSQFTSFLAILRARLDAAKVPYQYLDGDVEDRAARVARFQDDPEQSLFLISLKAGGVGLNLTAADYVFILDPWWNPAVEAQAVDRAHRIGQSQSVFVYRLLCRDTVEEKVAALQEAKRGLAESIINASQSLVRDLDRETLEMLLS
jgi:SNF2 domain-containing protein/helicase-like protein